VAVLAYDGVGRELVARLKYHNARSTVRWLAARMSALVDRHDIDVVTWVPTTSDRRRQRGFDQAELLARAIARRLHRPCRRMLTRGVGPPQTGRSVQERRGGPALAARRQRTPCTRVLVVDDVITTGTTVTVAARALRAAGFSHISVVAAAQTPLKTGLKRTGSQSDTCEE
jgi:ComF family protein